MLQQTQAQKVIPYFLRFIKECPDIERLASASPAKIARLWSGLGYYARAHNLNKAAKIVCAEHSGKLPRTLDGLLTLPGIGRSTAGAILAICHAERVAILDGNVKRLIARHRLVEGWSGHAPVSAKLWGWSQQLLPAGNSRLAARMPDYTQAVMDIGATICTRRHARCDVCPVSADCLALSRGRVDSLPTPQPRKSLPTKSVCMVIATYDGKVLMMRRPATGIWSGLLSLPEAGSAQAARAWVRRTLGAKLPDKLSSGATVRHTFSHFHLEIKPLVIKLERAPRVVRDSQNLIWCKISVGIKQAPAPVKRFLSKLTNY